MIKNHIVMYYNKDRFEHTPDLRDPVTGDWLPLSESDKAKIVRSEEANKRIASASDAQVAQSLQMLTSILK